MYHLLNHNTNIEIQHAKFKHLSVETAKATGLYYLKIANMKEIMMINLCRTTIALDFKLIFNRSRNMWRNKLFGFVISFMKRSMYVYRQCRPSTVYFYIRLKANYPAWIKRVNTIPGWPVTVVVLIYLASLHDAGCFIGAAQDIGHLLRL